MKWVLFCFHCFSGCEDIIVERLSAENLLCTLAWSEEAHGSAWVQHQALHFLREEFSSLSRSPLLYDLSRHYLLQAIKSDFLQVINDLRSLCYFYFDLTGGRVGCA